jgi:hypothetical protein
VRREVASNQASKGIDAVINPAELTVALDSVGAGFSVVALHHPVVTGSCSGMTGSNTRLRARTGSLPPNGEKAAAVLDHGLIAVNARRSAGGGR